MQTGVVFPGPPAKPLVPDPGLNLKPWVLDWIKKYNTLPADQNPGSRLAFEGKLEFVRAWSDYYGRPVHIGEFGADTKADGQSRANFYSAFRRRTSAGASGTGAPASIIGTRKTTSPCRGCARRCSENQNEDNRDPPPRTKPEIPGTFPPVWGQMMA